MFIQLHVDGITIRISHCEISQRQDIPWLFPVNSITIFDYCVTHKIVPYLNRSKFNCFIQQRSVQARHLFFTIRFISLRDNEINPPCKDA